MGERESNSSRLSHKTFSFRSGLVEGMFGPGLGTFAAMTGFGSLAGDAGTPLWAAVALTIGVWSMPGQVAFVDLYSSGASLLGVLLIVTVANIRMFPLTIATIPLLREGRGIKASHFMMAHCVAGFGVMRALQGIDLVKTPM